MRISVVMAVYNGKKYIDEQISSIVGQTLKPDEMVLIDDASVDDCGDIIGRYKDKGIDIRYFCHEANQGYGKTFFEALEVADGDIIFLADQDDVWVSDKIETMAREFQENSQILCLSCRNTIINGEGEVLKKEKAGKARCQKVSMADLIRQNALRPGMTLAISRKLRDMVVGVDTEPFVQHDRLIEFVACKEGGFFVLNEYLSYYRIHGQNTSGMNLTNKPRTDLDGRIWQAEKEETYLEKLMEVFHLETDEELYGICREYQKFFYKRKRLIQGNLCSYLYHVIGDMDKFSSIRIFLGDIYCMVSEARRG